MKRIWLIGIVYAALCPAQTEWRSVADHLVGTPAESYAFNWGEGVQMMGLMRAAAVVEEARYIDYVEKWARIYVSQDTATLLNIGPGAADPKRTGYCGHWSPASAILYLYKERPRPEYRKLARDVVDFIRSGAERNGEGALGHWQGSHQMWVDTLYMACPLLAGFDHADDAAHQIIVQSSHLQDPRSGLFYHMWDWQTSSHSEGFWGRGDGWVLMSIAETLETLPRKDKKYRQLQAIAQKLVRGLEATQDSDGLWHTVLDDPKSYAECSATAMFTYGILKLTRLEAMPHSLDGRALKAWQAINERYVKDGVVGGVSGGTGPRGREAYNRVGVGTETWGTGAYLLAASEVQKRAGKKPRSQ